MVLEGPYPVDCSLCVSFVADNLFDSARKDEQIRWGMGARVEWTNMFLVRSNVNMFKARISSSEPRRGARPSLVLFSRTSSHIPESPHSRARSINKLEYSESVRYRLELKEPRLIRNRAIFLFLSVGPSPFHLPSFLSAYFAPPMLNSDVGSSPPNCITSTERRYPVMVDGSR